MPAATSSHVSNGDQTRENAVRPASVKPEPRDVRTPAEPVRGAVTRTRPAPTTATALAPAGPGRDDDTPETLAARILIEEHRIYPEAVRIVLAGGWMIDGRRFVRPHQTPGISR